MSDLCTYLARARAHEAGGRAPGPLDADRAVDPEQRRRRVGQLGALGVLPARPFGVVVVGDDAPVDPAVLVDLGADPVLVLAVSGRDGDERAATALVAAGGPTALPDLPLELADRVAVVGAAAWVVTADPEWAAVAVALAVPAHLVLDAPVAHLADDRVGGRVHLPLHWRQQDANARDAARDARPAGPEPVADPELEAVAADNRRLRERAYRDRVAAMLLAERTAAAGAAELEALHARVRELQQELTVERATHGVLSVAAAGWLADARELAALRETRLLRLSAGPRRLYGRVRPSS